MPFRTFRPLLKSVLSHGSIRVNGAFPGAGQPEQEDLCGFILEHSPDGQYRLNLKTRCYDFFNPELARLTGLAPSPASGIDLDQFARKLHPEDRDRVVRELAALLAAGDRSGTLEYRLEPPGSGYRWFADSFRILGDASGQPAFQVGTIRDITPAKERELSDQSGDETLRSFIELLPVGIALISFDGKFLFLNGYFQETYGYDIADIPTVEKWFARAYPDPDYRAKVVTVFRTEPGQLMPNGAPVPLRETLVTCKDGSVRHVIFNRQLARDYRIIILTDITERERLHAELLKLQRLESLGVLAGGIAHDFNNILTGIVGNLSLARLLFDARDWSSELLEQAESETQRAVRLTAQLLTFAKGGTPVKKPISAAKILKESVALVLGGSNVKGAFAIAEPLDAVEADEAQFRQACSNLILNALQAMPEGGTLTVGAENLTLGTKDQAGFGGGSYLRITFSDEGCGIAPEIQEKIFDPYFSTKPDGDGLGLAAAHSIVTRHGGRLSVRSEVGKGACFTMVLPSTGAPLPESPAPASRPNRPSFGAGDRILLMDDEKSIRNIASKMLECLSYRVTVCNTGEEAVQLFRSAREEGTPYRVVILDLTVRGGMGGEEAAQRILELDPQACLIVSSGYSSNPVLADHRAYGFRAIMPKPYRLNDMETVLSQLT